jgi:hypothetical protein
MRFSTLTIEMSCFCKKAVCTEPCLTVSFIVGLEKKNGKHTGFLISNLLVWKRRRRGRRRWCDCLWLDLGSLDWTSFDFYSTAGIQDRC